MPLPMCCRNLMARVTTSSIIPPFKHPTSVSSLQSKSSSLRLQFPNLYVTCGSRITCRYGGGGGSSRQEDSRRSQQASFDDDPALDISTISRQLEQPARNKYSRVLPLGPASVARTCKDPIRVRSNTVRFIDDQQNMVGIVSKSAAIQMAEDAELDLVILSPDADPPVVNKYKYEQQKKKREQQKKNAASRMDQKELKMGYNIDVHDYSVRLRAAQKFLKDGDKVKVIVNLKGRENEFRNNAVELLHRFRDDIGELGIEESKNFKDRNMFMVLIPNKVVVQKEPPKKKGKSTGTELSASV
ncbi:Translation initiation factor 3 [Cynara cardunculus var. scolymus]|uniref:Translation initiation factor 3 n=1 Tax=Cynara cardunculus var. scolymus TaxID=59895 RepID=A0A118K764_CYNCS|nr:Translation initiation factor 3 [Cynara cardunculus var. scolymus]